MTESLLTTTYSRSAETYPEMERRQLDFVHLQSQHESISIVGKLSISTNHRNYFWYCLRAAFEEQRQQARQVLKLQLPSEAEAQSRLLQLLPGSQQWFTPEGGASVEQRAQAPP